MKGIVKFTNVGSVYTENVEDYMHEKIFSEYPKEEDSMP